ncbi:hypothetical protein [Lactobacillus sp. 3B(2020)]|uniref:hypothetical protein n=1 Tax=Lactobacillus sp. 3B(2020) TaxID=2695882 RepID=UPI0015DDC367|nr:hypothetical protein [Lactobacillus sp. 3B(2020)]QLL70382.1 hypothetical protein GTO83_07545 [Lactobacillus sp. 3B(2020)]
MAETQLTREELRRQREANTPPKTTATVEKHPWHLWRYLVAILVALFFMVGLWAHQTVLNESKAEATLTNTTVLSTVQSELNSGLTQYGLSDLVTTSDTKSILHQLVTEVYGNQKLSLDLSSITERVSNEANSSLSVYGVQIPSQLTNGVAGTVNTAINNQLNTSQLQNFEQGLQVAKFVDWAIMIFTGLWLGLLAIRELKNHSLRRYLSVVSLLSGILMFILVAGVNGYLKTLNFSNAIANSILTATTNTVTHTGQLIALIAVIIGLSFLVLNFIFRRRQRS